MLEKKLRAGFFRQGTLEFIGPSVWIAKKATRRPCASKSPISIAQGDLGRAGGVKAHVDVYSQDFLTRTNLTSSLAETVWGAIGGNHEGVI